MTHVAGQTPDHRNTARARRRGVAVGASLLAHVAVFAIIGFNAPKLIAPAMAPERTANLWLMPRFTPQMHKPAEHRAVEARAVPLPALRQPTPRRPAPAPPTQAAPAPGQGAPSGIKTAPAPAQPGADQPSGSVQEALRTSVGCDYDRVVHLRPGEVDRCNQTAGAQARAAPAFIGIDAGKRVRFDAQAEADERRRALRDGPVPQVMVPCAGQEGANFGVGCLPDSAIAHLRPH